MVESKNTKNAWAEQAGWYGMTAILAAYALVSYQIIPANGMAYQLLNLSGATGLLWISAVKKVMPLIALNAVWAAVAITALARILF